MKLQPKPKGTSFSDPFSNAARFIWARLSNHMLMVHTPTNKFDDSYSSVIFTLGRGSGKHGMVGIDLTSLTHAELMAFRETVLIATEAAEPVVKALDQRAQEERQSGNDSDPRCYRPLPTVIIRKGAFREYAERLLLGREHVLRGIGADVLRGGGPSDPDDGLGSKVEGGQEGTEDNS